MHQLWNAEKQVGTCGLAMGSIAGWSAGRKRWAARAGAAGIDGHRSHSLSRYHGTVTITMR